MFHSTSCRSLNPPPPKKIWLTPESLRTPCHAQSIVRAPYQIRSGPARHHSPLSLTRHDWSYMAQEQRRVWAHNAVVKAVDSPKPELLVILTRCISNWKEPPSVFLSVWHRIQHVVGFLFTGTAPLLHARRWGNYNELDRAFIWVSCTSVSLCVGVCVRRRVHVCVCERERSQELEWRKNFMVSVSSGCKFSELQRP